MLKQIDLLRHREAEGGRMYRGQTDHPLHAGAIRAIIVANVLKAPLLAMYRMRIDSAGIIAVKFR